jgi:hypothetical protein
MVDGYSNKMCYGLKRFSQKLSTNGGGGDVLVGAKLQAAMSKINLRCALRYMTYHNNFVYT